MLSAGITSFVNWLIQGNNYENDYYKKILDKRLQTYESVEEIVEKLNMLTQHDDGRVYHSIFFTHEYYIDFLILLSPYRTNNLWLSNELSEKLTEFSIFLLHEVGNELSNESTNEEYQLTGLRVADRVRGFKNDMYIIFNHELGYMHNVKLFLKRKKEKNRPKYPVYKQEQYRRMNPLDL